MSIRITSNGSAGLASRPLRPVRVASLPFSATVTSAPARFRIADQALVVDAVLGHEHAAVERSPQMSAVSASVARLRLASSSAGSIACDSVERTRRHGHAERAARRPARSRRRTCPPSSSTSRLLIVSPSPVPPYFARRRAVGLRERVEHAIELLARHADAGVDSTSNQQRRLAVPSLQQTQAQCRPDGRFSVNLIALPTRLTRIWRSRVGSLLMRSGIPDRTRSRKQVAGRARAPIRERTSAISGDGRSARSLDRPAGPPRSSTGPGCRSAAPSR